MTPESAATDLLRSIGITAGFRLNPLPGGRNNAVWRVDCENESFLLKKYFWSESDPRDRLGQEWAFLEFTASTTTRKTPAPLAKNPSARFALLEFIKGSTPAEVSSADILDAVAFLAAINSAPDLATNLPPVSEACFSLDSHLATTRQRVELLSKIKPVSPDHAAAVDFIRSSLEPLWENIHDRIVTIPSAARATTLPRSHRCISPSDFGFHNSLRQSDGTLRYLDFEYAGWDDPAKTLIDFTNQPDRILPDSLASLFLEKSIPLFADPTSLQERITILTPLYQLKWACICLNAFLPDRPSDPSRPLESQLIRSQTMAQRAAQSLKPQD